MLALWNHPILFGRHGAKTTQLSGSPVGERLAAAPAVAVFGPAS